MYCCWAMTIASAAAIAASSFSSDLSREDLVLASGSVEIPTCVPRSHRAGWETVVVRPDVEGLPTRLELAPAVHLPIGDGEILEDCPCPVAGSPVNNTSFPSGPNIESNADSSPLLAALKTAVPASSGEAKVCWAGSLHRRRGSLGSDFLQATVASDSSVTTVHDTIIRSFRRTCDITRPL